MCPLRLESRPWVSSGEHKRSAVAGDARSVSPNALQGKVARSGDTPSRGAGHYAMTDHVWP